MNAIILSVGDELVLGQTVDTNSAWISRQCAAVGVDVIGHKTVGDDQTMIEVALLEAAEMADVILLSGGLGPTDDDLTRQAVASLLEAELVEHTPWLKEMESFFQKLGRPMPEKNRIQAMIPEGAEPIWNFCGTAAGIEATLETTTFQEEGEDLVPVSTSAVLFAMPGVPKEMKAMFARDVEPWLRHRGGGAVIVIRTLHTFGLGESAIAEKLGPLMTRGQNPSVGTTVAGGVVSIRVYARFPSADEAKRALEKTVADCRTALGDLIYGEDDQTLAQVVGDMLKAAGKKVATAESCTGGLLAKMLTDTGGSSAYFGHGWVTYANEAKVKQLQVSEASLQAHGAVSEQVAVEMALGAATNGNADFGLGISGIAGPDGGTPTKPVGTVCIALAAKNDRMEKSRTFVFPGDREMIRDRSAKMALTMLRYRLLGKELPF